MDDVQIKLSVIWIALMFTYLLGDLEQWGQSMWLGNAMLMVIPMWKWV